MVFKYRNVLPNNFEQFLLNFTKIEYVIPTVSECEFQIGYASADSRTQRSSLILLKRHRFMSYWLTAVPGYHSQTSLEHWNRSVSIYSVNYHREMKILGIWFALNIRGLSTLYWKPIVQNIKHSLRELSVRIFCLIQKIARASHVWYNTQILPL